MDYAFWQFGKKHITPKQGVPSELQRERKQRIEQPPPPSEREAERPHERRVRQNRAEWPQQKKKYLEEMHDPYFTIFFACRKTIAVERRK